LDFLTGFKRKSLKIVNTRRYTHKYTYLILSLYFIINSILSNYIEAKSCCRSGGVSNRISWNKGAYFFMS